jgi:hypothetical protein
MQSALKGLINDGNSSIHNVVPNVGSSLWKSLTLRWLGWLSPATNADSRDV